MIYDKGGLSKIKRLPTTLFEMVGRALSCLADSNR